MAKRKAAVVSDNSSDDEGLETKPEDDVKPAREKSKQKGKVVKKEEQDVSGNESSPSSKESSAARTKKKLKSDDATVRINDEGDKYIDLGKRKRATVRKFKGSSFVDIREFYETGGVEKPGKKGISLSFEQWKCLDNNQGLIYDLFEGLTK